MPFTPTHVLAVIPFMAVRRVSLPFSALVIGSMIPDFPLFVPLGPGYPTTHSPAGVLTVCLPFGLSCYLLFQALMKRPLLGLLPEVIQCRCASLAGNRAELKPRAIWWASTAVVIGASTHLFWDSFTHRGRWGTRLLPGLDRTTLTLAGHALPGYKVLQYGSTLVGLPCLALLLVVWLRRRKPEPIVGFGARSGPLKATVGLVAVAVPLAVTLLVSRRGGLSAYERLGRSITTSGLALMALTLGYCLVFHGIESHVSRAKPETTEV
jgi:hypothetical protein